MRHLRHFYAWGAAAVLVLVVLCWLLQSDDKGRTPASGKEPVFSPSQAVRTMEWDSPATPSARAIASLSEPVRLAVTNGSYLERKTAILSLNKELSSADCLALCQFLKAPMTEQELNVTAAIKNSVLHALRGQIHLPEPYPLLLIGLFNDAGQHPVLRDYVLQHLVHWHEENFETKVLEEVREEVRKTLWSALSETTPTLAGTALLGLQYLSREEPKIETSQVGAAALQLASNATAAVASRATALQICAQLQVRAALPAAREIGRAHV